MNKEKAFELVARVGADLIKTIKTMDSKPKFKVGDRVKIRPDMSLKEAERVSPNLSFLKEFQNYQKQGVCGVVERGLSKEGNYSVQMEDILGTSYYLHPCWLILEEEEGSFVEIEVSELERIHAVACDSWKEKIEKMVRPFQKTVRISNGMVDLMFKAATEAQLPVVKDVFKDYKKENEFYTFVEKETLGLESWGTRPLYIRNGHSTKGMAMKELGISDSWEAILVTPDGKEKVLEGGYDGAYFKFRRKN